MAWDVGRPSLAQRYYIQGLDLAMIAGDRRYGAYVMSQMSWMTVQIGAWARTGHDQRRNARQAVALARAGLNVADSAATPALAAQLHAMHARGLALLGDTDAARRMLLEAERHYDRFRADDEPPWLSIYTEAGFVTDLGRCLRDTGDTEQATKLIAQALGSVEPWKVGGRCAIQTDLAITHLLGQDFEQAAALGRDALRTATEVNSTQTLDGLRTLQHQVRPLRSASPYLADLDARISDFLARAARRHQQDNTL